MHVLSHLLSFPASYPLFLTLLTMVVLISLGTPGHAKNSWRRPARLVHSAAIWLCLCTFLVGCTRSGCDEEDDWVIRSHGHVLSMHKLVDRLVGEPRQASASLSTTPHLQFQGNLTTLVPAFDSSGNVYQVGLQRQSNCSITEALLAINATTTGVTSSVQSSFPNYQNTLHSLAGLTTTANQWPNGCKDPVGITSTFGVYVGPTKDGSLLIGAGLNVVNANVLYVGTVPPTGGTASTTAVTAIPNPISVATADVNGDGNNDLVVADYPNSSTGDKGGIYVMLGHGDGTFATPVLYAAGPAPGAVAIDDVNNDGKLDLVVASSQAGLTNGIAVLLGNGDGTFQAAVASPSAGGSYVATGDFNGDGKKDIVLSNGAIQLGKGDGTFAAAAFTLPASPGTETGAPAVGDFNNDGKLDVALNLPPGETSGPFISIFLGNGDGTFTAGASYTTIFGTTNLVSADLDGDGNLDLVAGIGNMGLFGPDLGSNGMMEVLMGNGDGTFRAAPSFNNTTTVVNNVAPTFAVGDFNGDGYPDILAAAISQQGNNPVIQGMLLLAGDGKGNFTPGQAISGSSPTIFAAADMNGDGKLDAVVADGSTNVGVALGNGAGGFQATKDYAVPNGEAIQDLALGDFNGDGKPDVLVTAVASSAANPNAAYLFLNNGDGTLAQAKQVGTAVTPQGLALGDLNGDGKLDFVMTDNGINSTTNTQGAMLVYLGKGDGTFAAPVSYNPGFFPGSVAIADMNNDGKLDVLVGSIDEAYTTGTLSIYLGNGDGTLQTPLTTTLPDTYFTNFAVADVNGDGNPDVAVGDCCGTTYTSVLLGKGDGTIAGQYALAVALSSDSVTTVDVNGDKRPDLLLTSGPLGGTSIQVLLNLYGQATTSLPATTTTLSVSPNPAVAGQAVTLTATVSAASGSGVPTGTVTFLNGTASLGTGQLDATGKATLTTSALPVGTSSLTAAYGGDTTFAASTSAAISVTVTSAPPSPPDFTLGISPTSLSITPGQSGTATVSVTPVNGFNQAVAFACSGLPAEAACTFSPATVTPSGTAASTTTMTVTTTAASTAGDIRWPIAGGGIALGMGLLFFRRRKPWPPLVCMALVLCLGGIVLGCGGGSNSSAGGGGSGSTTAPGTPAGTGQVTITATAGSGASVDSHTATLSLTIQ